MFTINKAEKLLNLVKEEYPSLYNELIFIEEYGDFHMRSMFDMCVISIVNKIEQDDHTKWIYKYLKDQYNLDSNIYMFYDFIETFAFLHEVGHLYYKDLTTTEEVELGYKEYKEKTYDSYIEAWETYRNIPNEKIADEFAVNFIKNNTIKVWAIMNECTKEQAQEEYEFWSEIED